MGPQYKKHTEPLLQTKQMNHILQNVLRSEIVTAVTMTTAVLGCDDVNSKLLWVVNFIYQTTHHISEYTGFLKSVSLQSVLQLQFQTFLWTENISAVYGIRYPYLWLERRHPPEVSDYCPAEKTLKCATGYHSGLGLLAAPAKDTRKKNSFITHKVDVKGYLRL